MVLKEIITNFKNAKLYPRIMASLILMPIVILLIYTGGVFFNIALLTLAVLMSYEWADMVLTDKRLRILGLFYIAIPIASMIIIRNLDNGMMYISFLILTVWATDIAAYFTGILLKGPKLAPKISPKKTISGAVCALFAASCVGIVYSWFFQFPFIKVAFCISLLAQMGDLLESYIKRRCNIKDSSNLIPGHGGILDRMDSFIFSAPFLYIIVAIS